MVRSPWPAHQANIPALTFLASLCMYLAVCLASSVFPNKKEGRGVGLGLNDLSFGMKEY